MDRRFALALQRKVEELGVEPPALVQDVKCLRSRYPSWGEKVLYFFVQHGRLVYVGITQNLRKRLSQHRTHKVYKKLQDRTGVYYLVLDCDDVALRDTEASLIQLFQPSLDLKS